MKKVAKLAEEKRVAKEKGKNGVTLREKEKKVINEVKNVVASKEKEKEKEVKKEVLVWKESTKSELF